MTICYFGIYNPDYARSRVLINGLKQNGVNVIECNSRRYGLLKYFDLFRKHWQIRGKYDFLLVGFPGYQAMVLARALARKPIIFDAFSSLYDSMVFDRRIVEIKSLKAKYYWFLDWLSCRLADKIVIDTQAHIDYFVENFKVKPEKFIRVFVGTDDRIMKLQRKEENKSSFLVYFYGSYIPLQGVDYILAAAEILKTENIKFSIIGTRIKESFKEYKLSNVNFINNVPYEKLPQYLGEADICLGIFGDTEKARRVIPNKVFDALALGQPVLTGASPAIKELLTDRENAFFCRLADSKDLAEKILVLKNDANLREKIAKNGYKLFNEKLTSRKIVADLISSLKLDKYLFVCER
jgi:glycosyltransferase involved in cell wall biosynthesis